MQIDTWRVRPAENLALKTVAGMVQLLTDGKTINALDKRIDAVPPLRKELEALTRLSEDLLAHLCLTVPSEQRKSLVKQLQWSEITVGTRSVASEPEYFLILLKDMQTLTDYALRAECYLCEKSEAEAHKCPLRKVLDSITVHDIPRVKGCSYRGASIDEAHPWPEPTEKENAK